MESNGNVEQSSAIVCIEENFAKLCESGSSSNLQNAINFDNEDVSSNNTVTERFCSEKNDLSKNLEEFFDESTNKNAVDAFPPLEEESQQNCYVDDSFSELLNQPSIECYYDGSDPLRHRVLSPIYEENEDVRSVISSVPQYLDLENQFETSFSLFHPMQLQSASYDSLASFEANEKLLMMMENTPKKEIRKKPEKINKNGIPLSDEEEQDILNYELRRQKNVMNNSLESSPITSHILDLPNKTTAIDTAENNNTCNLNASKSRVKHNERISNTADHSSDVTKPLVNKHTKNVQNYEKTNSKLDTQRTLPLQQLKRNVPSSDRETLSTVYSIEDDHVDPFQDCVIGCVHRRHREDSIFDLRSLHQSLTKTFQSDRSSKRPSVEEICNVNMDRYPRLIHDEIDDIHVAESSEHTIDNLAADQKGFTIEENKQIEFLQSNPKLDSHENKENKKELEQSAEFQDARRAAFPNDNDSFVIATSSSLQTLGNDSAIESVAPSEEDFHSCTSSVSTSIPYEMAFNNVETEELLSDPGYLTPPETKEDLEFFMVADSDDSGTAVYSSVQSMFSPRPTTITSGATGYQTPPKWYYVIPPKFIGRKINEVTVVRGDTVVFECSIISHPEAKVAWYKDGRLLEIYDRISQHTSNQPSEQPARESIDSSKWEAPTILPTEVNIDIGCAPQLDVHYLLKIKNAINKDEGCYVCKAWNSAGVATRIINLIVSSHIQ